MEGDDEVVVEGVKDVVRDEANEVLLVRADDVTESVFEVDAELKPEKLDFVVEETEVVVVGKEDKEVDEEGVVTDGEDEYGL